MKLHLRLLMWLLSLLAAACQENETMPARDYPRLNTLDVTKVSDKGATLRAEFSRRGNFEILRYGFVWSEGEQPVIGNAERVIFDGNIQSREFSATIFSRLASDRVYYVRPFVQTKDHMVYGKQVSFTSRGSLPPLIVDFFPRQGAIGDTVSIAGNGFSYRIGFNIVTFNSSRASVASMTDTLLRVIVPNVSPGESSVSVEIVGKKATASQKFILQ